MVIEYFTAECDLFIVLFRHPAKQVNLETRGDHRYFARLWSTGIFRQRRVLFCPIHFSADYGLARNIYDPRRFLGLFSKGILHQFPSLCQRRRYIPTICFFWIIVRSRMAVDAHALQTGQSRRYVHQTEVVLCDSCGSSSGLLLNVMYSSLPVKFQNVKKACSMKRCILQSALLILAEN